MMRTTPEAARYLKITAGTLRNMRSDGSGPESCGTGITRGSPVLYREEDLDRWAEARRIAKHLSSYRWRTVPLKTLRAVDSLLAEIALRGGG